MGIAAVILDSREPEWVKNLAFNAPVAINALDTGDAQIACDDGTILLVERKTPEDFLHSLKSGRLMIQTARLAECRELDGFWPYLVITDEIHRGPNGKAITQRGETGWNWNSIQGAILSIQESGVFVQFCAGDMDYANCLKRLAERDHDSKKLIMPTREAEILGTRAAFIAGLPGIGLEKVKTVLQYCGNPAWSLVALTNGSIEIPGIGPSIIRNVRWALGLQDDQQMGVLTNDNGDEVMAVLAYGEQ